MVVRGEVIEGDWCPSARGRRASSRAPTWPSTSTGCRCPPRWPWPTSTTHLRRHRRRPRGSGPGARPRRNPHLQVAHDAALLATPLPPALLQNYRSCCRCSTARSCGRWSTPGRDRLPEGWVEQTLVDGRQQRIRAFGSRALHIRRATAPVSGVSVLRTVSPAATPSSRRRRTTRSPRSPSPARWPTSTRPPAHEAPRGRLLEGRRHRVEERLYRPEHVEKIVAWGGFASVKHVTRYLQPGLEMIALDPKRSASIIGPEAFGATRRCARWRAGRRRRRHPQPGGLRLARVIYVLSGTDPEGLANGQPARRDDLRGAPRLPRSSAPRR